MFKRLLKALKSKKQMTVNYKNNELFISKNGTTIRLEENETYLVKTILRALK